MPENDTTVVAGRDYDAEAAAYTREIDNLAEIGNLTPPELAAVHRRKPTVDEFKRELRERAIANGARTASVVSLSDFGERVQREYMITRGLNAAFEARQGNPNAWKRAGIEREVSDEIAKRIPAAQQHGGFFVPLTSLATRASVTGNVALTASLGGAGVQTTILDLVELLRNNTICIQAGARVLTGLTANITFPRQITPNVLAWTGENPATGTTNTAATFDTVALTPKTAMVSTAVSRQLVVQSTFDAENFVREDLSQVVGLGIDNAAINGIGSANQPTGLRFISGVPTVTTTFGSNGAVPDWAAIVAFETTLAENNAPGTNWVWATTPGVRGKLKQTLQNTVSGASWIWAPDNTINGYKALVSNQIPSNLTMGTSTTVAHAMFLGNWSELIIGEWGAGMEFLVDPYTVASQNMIQFHTFLMMDCNVRHPKSFAIAESVLIA
jgi:HK97 family phage major capsid protein